MCDVPMVSYTGDGLSMIAMKVSRPMMLDAYTSNMCFDSWGRNIYAKTLIEIDSEKDLCKEVVVAIPKLDNGEYSLETVKVDYEWSPPICSGCKVFGHTDRECPKHVTIQKLDHNVSVDKDGFTAVVRKGKKKQGYQKQARHVEGIKLQKPKPQLVYRQKSNPQHVLALSGSKFNSASSSSVPVKNSYDSLVGDNAEVFLDDEDDQPKGADILNQEEDDSDVEVIYDESASFLDNTRTSEGASTPIPRVFRNWNWSSNGSLYSKGTRIAMGWNLDVIDLMILSQTDQAMHTQIILKADKKVLFCSFVYAHNSYTERRKLWDDLRMHKLFVKDKPWAVLDDFNAALLVEDSSIGSSSSTIAMREFSECVNDIEVRDINMSGLFYTWNQKPNGGMCILKKLDRVLANLELLDEFSKPKSNQFKFSNLLVHNPKFKELVSLGWKDNVKGVHMYRVVAKLKALKRPLKRLMFEQGNLHKNVEKLRVELDEVQRAMDKDASNLFIREDHAAILNAYNAAILAEERFLKQKSKVHWLRVGDSNTAYFHKAVKGRVARNRIDVVIDKFGIKHDGVAGNTIPLNSFELFSKKVSDHQAIAWDIVKADIVLAVRDFFKTGRLLKQINHNILSLLPKVSSLSRTTDFRPISLCNVKFKCISKIIANRVKGCLNDLISINQSAFVPGRRITDNILLTQELMHNYHLDRGIPRCAFKVDIQKAYNTVDWRFLHDIFVGFGFPGIMVDWITECVSSTSFSISINGEIHCFFKGQRGLRQEDPLSPYLFTLIMEILTLILKRRVRDSESFIYHPKSLDVINLCFADDLFIFLHGDVASASVIMDGLMEFKDVYGLSPSLEKSTTYFCNVLNYVKQDILGFYFLKKADYQVIQEIEQLLRAFLWSRGQICKGKAKVAWEVICFPKNEGGLGICRLDLFNIALLSSLIWSIITLKESLWVRWIHTYKLRGQNFWKVTPKGNMTWSWRKLLQIRPTVRKFFWHCVGNDKSTPAWYGTWSDFGPLIKGILPRMIANAGFNLKSNVSDLIDNRAWKWPREWDSVLQNSAPPILHDK
uniref:uncharacterized protein LOC122591602 n=1 Tax=Erigeron canadensis TaxID=72917 RepID=UPI001CB8F52C|nr:uncharacterized protein LOC122591602 [Erigeron canadensis]